VCVVLGTRLGVIPEDDTSQVGVAGEVGLQQQFERVEDEEAKAAPVVLVTPLERGQNPETGQSEVEQEETELELRQEANTDNLEAPPEEMASTADVEKDVETEGNSSHRGIGSAAVEQEVKEEQVSDEEGQAGEEVEESRQGVVTDQQREEDHDSQLDKVVVVEEDQTQDPNVQEEELKGEEDQARQDEGSKPGAMEESSSERQSVAATTEDAVMNTSGQAGTSSTLIPLSQIPEVVKVGTTCLFPPIYK